MPTIDQLAAKATPILAEYDRALAKTRNDRNLSGEGRRASIAASYFHTVDKIRAIRAEATNSNAAEQKRLEDRYLRPQRPLGATVSDTIAQDASYRDALARARATDDAKPAELSQLLAEAEAVGDTLQAQAALAVAIMRGDSASTKVYAQRHPSAGDDLDRLQTLANSRADVAFEMKLAFQLPEPAMPSEVAQMGEYTARQRYAATAV